MIRSFEVRVNNPHLLNDIGIDLDRKLCELQQAGWEILSVNSIPCKQYYYPIGDYDSVVYVIVASYESYEE